MADEQDVQQDSSPALEAAMEASAASEQQTQQSQTETAEQAVTEEQTVEQPVQTEEQKVPYTRFQEVNQEKNWYKQQLEQQLANQQQMPQQIQQPPPQQNQYANMTPEEERFWRAVDERAAKVANEQFQKVTPLFNTGLQEIASMKVQQFRQAHPDIKPNSPEEVEIASRIQTGYDPNDAYWSVMGPRGVQRAENMAVKKVQQKIVQKRQANVESSAGVAPASQPKPKETIEETFNRISREEGLV
jgi:hypothetical protein